MAALVVALESNASKQVLTLLQQVGLLEDVGCRSTQGGGIAGGGDQLRDQLPGGFRGFAPCRPVIVQGRLGSRAFKGVESFLSPTPRVHSDSCPLSQ